MAYHLIIHIPESGKAKPTALKKVCSVPVITRLIVAASRNGADQISVLGSDEDVEKVKSKIQNDERLEKLSIQWGQSSGHADAVVEVNADLVVGNKVWTLINEAKNNAFVPGASLFKKSFSSSNDDSMALWQGDAGKECFVQPINNAKDRRRAKWHIFNNITKSTSGPVSRYLNAQVSIPLSKILVETPMTPNQMTVVNTLIGLFSAYCFAMGTLPWVALGGALFQLTAILDRNDGELARSKFMESEKGEWIDTIGDNMMYVAYMIGLPYGYWKYAQTVDLAWEGLIIPLAVGSLVMLVFVIGGMFIYLRVNKLGGSITVISRQFDSDLKPEEVPFIFRMLSKLSVLGERDQFSLAIGIFGVLPYFTGMPVFYHMLFFITCIVVLAANIYFGIGWVKIAKRKNDIQTAG